MKPRVLVLGATGMLGHIVLRWLALEGRVDVIGAARAPARFAPVGVAMIAAGDVRDDRALTALLARTRPDVVINCIGIVKQSAVASDTQAMDAINARWPHRLARACAAVGARTIHISTDCVFSGARGGYSEDDTPDPVDAYGRSKLAGEVTGALAVTLRTSIIGPELACAHGLLGWFLRAPNPVRGYTRARFSGLTTLELARIIAGHILPRPDLEGVYHVAGPAISKHDLLQLLARSYRPQVAIIPDDQLIIDRTLDGTRFHRAVGWRAPDWSEMVEAMRAFG